MVGMILLLSVILVTVVVLFVGMMKQDKEMREQEYWVRKQYEIDCKNAGIEPDWEQFDV